MDESPGDAPALTPEQIQSWKDMRVEICMYIKKSDPFWLVPVYTNKDRVEISIDDFVLLRKSIIGILKEFPESKIANVLPVKEKKTEQGHSR